MARKDASGADPGPGNSERRRTVSVDGARRDHGIKVVRRLGTVPLTQGAGSELNQVFLNLLTNSIDAIEESGSDQGLIAVETRTDGGDIVVEVCDNGPGIPVAILPRIFDPFFTTKPPGKGAGLGLAACHGIVTKHGGRIDVESQPLTQTRFRIRLPIPQSIQDPERR